MPFSVAVAMATVKPEGLAPPKKNFFKTIIILNYHVKFQVDITNIKKKCLPTGAIFPLSEHVICFQELPAETMQHILHFTIALS